MQGLSLDLADSRINKAVASVNWELALILWVSNGLWVHFHVYSKVDGRQSQNFVIRTCRCHFGNRAQDEVELWGEGECGGGWEQIWSERKTQWEMCWKREMWAQRKRDKQWLVRAGEDERKSDEWEECQRQRGKEREEDRRQLDILAPCSTQSWARYEMSEVQQWLGVNVLSL